MKLTMRRQSEKQNIIHHRATRAPAGRRYELKSCDRTRRDTSTSGTRPCSEQNTIRIGLRPRLLQPRSDPTAEDFHPNGFIPRDVTNTSWRGAERLGAVINDKPEHAIILAIVPQSSPPCILTTATP